MKGILSSESIWSTGSSIFPIDGHGVKHQIYQKKKRFAVLFRAKATGQTLPYLSLGRRAHEEKNIRKNRACADIPQSYLGFTPYAVATLKPNKKKNVI